MSRAAPPAWNDERALPIGDVSGNGDIVRRFAFSPNGRYLACGWECAHIVRVWDASTAEVVYDIPLPKNTEAGGVAWAPNGTRVAVTTRSYFKKPVHQVIIADFTPDGGRSHRTVFTCKNGLQGCAFHPSGDTLAVAVGNKRVAWYCLLRVSADGDYALIKEEQLFDINDYPSSVQFSSDGRLLVVGNSVMALNMEPGEKSAATSLCDPDLPNADDAAISSSGRVALAVCGWRAHAADIDVSQGTVRVGKLCCYPDTSLLRDGIKSCAFSADEKYIVTVTFNGSVQVWSPETHKLDGRLRVGYSYDTYGTFHPPSGQLAVGRAGKVFLYEPSLRSKVALGRATADETERVASLDKLLADGADLSAVSSSMLHILLQDWRLISLSSVVNDISGEALRSLTVGDLASMDRRADISSDYDTVCMLLLRAYMLDNKHAWSDQLGVLSWGACQVRRFLREYPDFTPVEPSWYMIPFIDEERSEGTDDEGEDFLISDYLDYYCRHTLADDDDEYYPSDYPLQEACLTGPGLASLSVKIAQAFEGGLEVDAIEGIMDRVRKQQEEFVKEGLAPAWTLKWTANVPISQL